MNSEHHDPVVDQARPGAIDQAEPDASDGVAQNAIEQAARKNELRRLAQRALRSAENPMQTRQRLDKDNVRRDIKRKGL